jgi:hypothetical protein
VWLPKALRTSTRVGKIGGATSVHHLIMLTVAMTGDSTRAAEVVVLAPMRAFQSVNGWMSFYMVQGLVSERLRRIIRSKLADGTLPRDEPGTMHVNIGSGNLCTACDHSILPGQTEYELHYDVRRASIRLHIGCYPLWKAELVRSLAAEARE